MKKTRFIALVLVVALALMGAGYAAWTDKLCVETKVKTGYLDVDIGCVIKDKHSKCITADHDIMANPRPDVTDVVDYGKDGEVDKDLLKVDIKNMFPGESVKYKIEFINQGTLAAKLINGFPKVTACDGNEIDPMYLTFKVNGKPITLPGINTLQEEEVQGSWPWPPQPEPIELISVGKSAYLDLEIGLKDNAPNDLTENKLACFKICFEYEQHCEGGGGWPHGEVMGEDVPSTDL